MVKGVIAWSTVLQSTPRGPDDGGERGRLRASDDLKSANQQYKKIAAGELDGPERSVQRRENLTLQLRKVHSGERFEARGSHRGDEGSQAIRNFYVGDYRELQARHWSTSRYLERRHRKGYQERRN